MMVMTAVVMIMITLPIMKGTDSYAFQAMLARPVS